MHEALVLAIPRTAPQHRSVELRLGSSHVLLLPPLRSVAITREKIPENIEEALRAEDRAVGLIALATARDKTRRAIAAALLRERADGIAHGGTANASYVHNSIRSLRAQADALEAEP